MTHPIHPARAAMVLRTAAEQDRWDDRWLSQHERDALNAPCLKTACQAILDSLSEDQHTIAKLQAGILMATDALSSWLADNTEEVFEEQPEIDGARSILIDTFH